jgi:SAM-dependent methyltransferase
LSPAAAAPRLAAFGAPVDFGARLNRARWRRGLSAAGISVIEDDGDAAATFAGPGWWVVLRQDSAILLDGSGARPAKGRIRTAMPATPVIAVHTLRELEAAPRCAAASGSAEGEAAIAFSPEDFAPVAGERAGAYVARLSAERSRQDVGPGFSVFSVPDASREARPELLPFLPKTARRLLDVGCGSGGFSAAWKRDRPERYVAAVEKDRAAAARAAPRLDRVLCGDASEAIARLAAEQDRFDTILFADVLEHLENPRSALRAARGVSAPGARLIASVPNARHLSIVRDLLHGRFDPAAAGLLDAGHRRWFDAVSLRGLLEETGWTVRRLEALPGAPAPDAARFLEWCAGFPGADTDRLGAYQWVAVAGAETPR